MLVVVGAAAVAAPVLAGGDGGAPVGGAKPPGDGPQHARDLAPLLASYCLGCHTGPQPEGEVALDSLADETKARSRWKVLRAVREKLGNGEMPPATEKQPTASERASAVAWIDAALRAAPVTPGGTTEPTVPGRVVLRRLTRVEYVNTVRDLLGVDVVADTDFPADDLGYGFDGVGDVLSVSPLLLEKYARAAERIADEAIVTDDPSARKPRRFEAEAPPRIAGAAPRDGTWLSMFAPSALSVQFTAAREGTYLLRTRAYGDQAGGEPARLGWTVDGKPAGDVDVPATRAAPAEYETPVRLARGAHTVVASFVNDYYKPDEPDPKDRDRNLVLDWIEIAGPVEAAALPASHRRIFATDPGRGDAVARARAVLRPLASRAWRRQVEDVELARLAKFAADAASRGASFEKGIALALQAVLVSPHFVFRVEPGADGRAMNGYEVATRLSYFLWSSLPDETLTDAAKRGDLSKPGGVDAQVRRMLRDPRASALATNFAAQWLELRNLEVVAPDPARFPAFDEDLRVAMRAETEMFFEAVLREGRDLRELLTADWTFLNERLAKHYGVPGVRGPAMRRVALGDVRPGGLLAQASFLTVTSNPTRTSPVKRGKWILDHLLASPPPPPTPGTDSFAGGDESLRAASIRVQMERHRQDPKCATCHVRMDVLGLALEHFDAVGAWRAKDGAFDIDATGTLPDGRKVDGVEGLRSVLADGDAFVRALAKKLFVHAVGRGPVADDGPAFDRLVASLPKDRRTLEDVLLGVARMDAFRSRGADAPASEER